MSDISREQAIKYLTESLALKEESEIEELHNLVLNMAIESIEKIEKIETILFQNYKHRDIGSEDSWYLEDIINVLKEGKQ